MENINIQPNGYTPAVCYGEVLWDVLPDGPQPGGAALNVAYHLQKLGVSTALVSRIGEDAEGKGLESLMDRWSIKKTLLQRDSQYPTSRVLATMDSGNEVSYEIVFPVAWDFISEGGHIVQHIRPSTYFVYGSLASRNEVTRNTLFELLDTDAIKVLDINLRPPFIDRGLLEKLLMKADIVKFNESELERVQTLFRGSYGNEAEQVRFIQRHFNIPEVIVTKAQFGASYYKGNQGYHVSGREVKVKDTVGSGDAFLAAFIAGRYLNEAPLNILKGAIAMGGFIATRKGGCPDYQLAELRHFRETNQ